MPAPGTLRDRSRTHRGLHGEDPGKTDVGAIAEVPAGVTGLVEATEKPHGPPSHLLTCLGVSGMTTSEPEADAIRGGMMHVPGWADVTSSAPTS